MKIGNERVLWLAIAALAAVNAHAAGPYYWDNNGTTAGFGTAGGTWGTSQNWNTDNTGLTLPGVTTALITDDLNFGYATTGLGAGTVGLSGTVNARSLTIASGSGAIILSGAAGTITLGGTGVVTVNNASDTIGNNTSATIAGTVGLTKAGAGTLTLNGSAVNGFTGGLTVNGGTLALDFANLATPTDFINSGNALTFGGGFMTIKAKTGAVTTSQTFNNVTVNAGGSLLVDPLSAGGTINVVLNSIGALSSWPGGSSLVLGNGTAGTGTLNINTTTAKDAQGIYGGRVVWFNGTANTGYDWATTVSGSSPYTLSAYSGYSALPTSGGTGVENYKATAATTLVGGITANSLKIENTAGAQALGANLLTLNSGGLLISGTAAASITGTAGGTRLTAGSGSNYDLAVHQYSSGGATISAVIGDNGGNAVRLTKAGTQTLTLSGVNTYTGGTTLNAGTLSLASGATLGTGPININGGQITLANVNWTLANAAVINGSFTMYLTTTANLTWNAGSFKIAGPITWNINGTGTPTITPVVTDLSGGNTCNALDITPNFQNTGLGLVFSAPITLRGNQTYASSGTANGITFSGAIMDAGNGYGLTVNGTSGMTLAGSSIFTGSLTINSGATVYLTGATASTWGSIQPSSITINPGGALYFFDGNALSGGRISASTTLLNNGTVRFGSSPNVGNNRNLFQGIDFSSVLSGSGTYYMGGTSGGHSYSITLYGLNDFTGPISIGNIDGGSMKFTSIRNVSSGVSSLGAPTAAGNGTITFTLNATAPIEYIGSGNSTDRVFDLAATINAATIRAAGATTVASPFEITSNFDPTSVVAKTLTLGGTGVGKWSGIIKDKTAATAVTKADAGTWILSGANTYSGVTTLSAGGGTLNISSIDVVANANPLGKSSAAAANLLLGNGTTLKYTGGVASTDRAFTINGTAAGHSATLDASGSGAITFSTTTSPSYGTAAQTRTLILAGSNTGNNILAANIGDNGAAVSLTKNGAGTWLLSGSSIFTGTTTVNAGTLGLDFSAASAPAVNIINNVANSSALALGGGTLSLTGKASTSNSQRFNGVTVGVGNSAIVLTANPTANPLLLTLGAITRNSGGTVNVTLPTGTQDGANGVTTTSTTFLNNNVLASAAGGTAFATVGGTDWATQTGAGNIVPYSSLYTYTTTTGAGTTAANYANVNIDVDNSAGTLSGAITPNTLRFNTAAANTVTLSGVSTNGAGGILVTANVGNNLSTITGSTLVGSTTGKDLVVIQNNASGGMVISSVIANNASATALTKSGAGTLTLSGSGANTYTGTTYVNAGTLMLSKVNGSTATIAIPGALIIGSTGNPAAPLVQYAASTTNPDMIGAVSVAINSAGQLDFNGATDTIGGGVTIVAAGSTGNTTPILNTAGGGNLTINNSGNNTVLGITPIDGFTSRINTGTGKLTLGYRTDNGGSGNVTFTAAGTGRAWISGNLGLGNTTHTFTVNPGTGTASALSGLNESYDMLIDAVISSDYYGGALTKAGAGVLKLSSANTYIGSTTLSGGTLIINNDNNMGLGALVVSDNSTLQFAASSSVSIARPVALSTSGKTLSVDTSLADGTITGLIDGPGSLAKANLGTLTLSAANTFSGNLTISAGRLVMGNALALQNATYVTTGSTAGNGLDATAFTTLKLGALSGAVDLAAAIKGYNAITSITVNTPGGSQTYSGVISDGAAGMTLIKAGAGTQILSSPYNSYTGGTTVNAGTLQLNGTVNMPATGTLTVNAGGTFSLADGTVSTTTTIPGLNLASGANLQFDWKNAAADRLTSATAATTVAGPVGIIITASTPSGGPYTLLSSPNGGLNNATYYLVNNPNFTTTLSQSDTAVTIGGYATVTQLSNAYWLGNQLGGAPGVMAFSSGTTCNWASDAAGTLANGAVPSVSTANVIFSATGASQQANVTLGANMNLNSVTFNDTAAVTLAGSGLYLKLNSASGTAASTTAALATVTPGCAISVTAYANVNNTISANLLLGGSQTWDVASGKTLTLSGNVTDGGIGYTLTKQNSGTLNLNGTTSVGSVIIGNNTAGGSIVVGSGGTLSIGNGPGCNLYIGYQNAASGTLDASLASTVTINVGTLRIAYATGTGSGLVGTLKLGHSNNITATTDVCVGAGFSTNSGEDGTLTLADNSTTTINTPALYVGHNVQSAVTGTLKLQAGGSSATLALNGIAGGRAALYVGQQDTTYANLFTGLMDLTSVVADLRLNKLVVGQSINNRLTGDSGTSTGTLILSTLAANHLDISGPGNVVVIGYDTGSENITGNVTIGNLDASSAITSTDNSTAIFIGYKLSTGAGTGTLALNGGTLTITTTGSAIAGGNGNSTLSLSNCTLVAGASSTNWITSLSSAAIANSVTFSSGAYNITVPQAFSGTGSLIKDGTGTLTISGSNSYSGSTIVSNGTLRLAGSGSISSSANIKIMPGGVLDVTNKAVYAMAAADTYTFVITNSSVGRIDAGSLDISNARVVLSGAFTNAGVYVLAAYTNLAGSGFAYTNGTYNLDYNYNNLKQIALIQPAPSAPGVSNTGATNQVVGSCTLQGELSAGGYANVWICWGTNDAGTSATGRWNNVVSLGQVMQSNTFSTVASGLVPNLTYWYRCYASNDFGTAWASPATWFNAAPGSGGAGDGYSMQITFTNFAGMGSLSNFPALVKLTTNNAANYIGFINTNGYELRFWDNSALSGTELNYEIEQFSVTSNSFIWVQVPLLTNNCSIWASWGSLGSTNQQAYTTNGATWSDGFNSVWHFSETTGNRMDSKAGYTGTPTSINATNGMIAGGISLNGSSSKLVTTYGQPAVTAYTAMAWINTTTAGNAVILQDRGAGPGKSLSLGIGKNSAGKLWYALDSDSIIRGVQDGTAVNNGVWRHIVGIWSAPSGAAVNNTAQFTIYVDGVLCTGTSGLTTGSSTSPLTGAGASAIGYHQAWGTYFPGGLDEVTASSVLRASNWVWACYMNQGSSHNSFSQYGTPVQGTVIRNLAPAGITSNSAMLNATLACPGTNYDVYVYWGPADKTNSFAWSSSAHVGAYTNVATTNVSYTAAGLDGGMTYFYTFRATNAATNVWATPSWNFALPWAPRGTTYILQ